MLQRSLQCPLLPATRSPLAPVSPSMVLARSHWKLALVAGLFGMGLLAAEAIGPWLSNRNANQQADLGIPPAPPTAEVLEQSRQQVAESAAIVRGQVDPNWQPQMRPVQPLNMNNLRQNANATGYYNSDQAQGGYNYNNNSHTNSRTGGYNAGGTPNRYANPARYRNLAYPNYNQPNNQFDRSRQRGSWNQGSFPVENFQAYTSPFGYRRWGGNTEFHKGLDLAAPKGSYIRSWWAGRVTKVSDGGLCGTSITIQSGAWEHIYCHMMGRVETWQGRRYLSDRDGGLRLFQGQTVTTGMRIGRVGMTGRTTGPHLHWGIRYGQDWIDPALVLRAMYQQQSKGQ